MAQRRSSGSRPGSSAGRANARAATVDDLPDPVPPVVCIVGEEELLAARALTAVLSAVRRREPDVIESERSGGELEGPELHELLGPSLFSDARLLVVRSAQDIRAAVLPTLASYLSAPAEGLSLVLQHAGGAKGKAVLEAARAAPALEIPCPRLTRFDERIEFVRSEVRGAGGRIDPDAARTLVDAVGSDLRELAAAASQLVSDSDGHVTKELVRAFHQGRAEVSGFAVADQVVVGNVAGALEALRYALDLGVPHVVIADALADGVRTVARVSAAGRGNPYSLAKTLALPPWKVERAQTQARGWTETGMRRALRVVADLNADVKGVAADPAWALERAVRMVAQVRAAG